MPKRKKVGGGKPQEQTDITAQNANAITTSKTNKNEIIQSTENKKQTTINLETNNNEIESSSSHFNKIESPPEVISAENTPNSQNIGFSPSPPLINNKEEQDLQMQSNADSKESSSELQGTKLNTEIPLSKTRVNSINYIEDIDDLNALDNDIIDPISESQPLSLDDHTIESSSKGSIPLLKEDTTPQTNDFSEETTTQELDINSENITPNNEELPIESNYISEEQITEESFEDPQNTRLPKPKAKSQESSLYQKGIGYLITVVKFTNVAGNVIDLWYKPNFENAAKFGFNSALLTASIFSFGWFSTGVLIGSMMITLATDEFESASWQVCEATAWTVVPYLIKNKIVDEKMIMGYSVKNFVTNAHLTTLLYVASDQSYKTWNSIIEKHYGSNNKEFYKESYETWLARTKDLLYYAQSAHSKFPNDKLYGFIKELKIQANTYEQKITELQPDAEKDSNYYIPTYEYKEEVDVSGETTSPKKEQEQNHDEV